MNNKEYTEYMREYMRKYQRQPEVKKRRALARQNNRQRDRDYIRHYRIKLRLQIVEHYGGKCSCPKCPETNPLFLTIDHINNDGNTHRKGDYKLRNTITFYKWIIDNNFPTDLRIACWNCNSGRHTNGGICPHLL